MATFTCIHVFALSTESLPEKPWTENQKGKLLITTVGKVMFNEIMPVEFPYLNEPTRENLEEATPDKFFVEPGTDIKAHIEQQEIVGPFKKKTW